MTRQTTRARSLAAIRGWRMRRAHTRKRSKAAKKGWETRRRRAQKRSDAERKGWETRRARKRSDAAKKGWDTRRKRQEDEEYPPDEEEEEEEPDMDEYTVNVNYKERSGHAVSVQFSVIGPAGLQAQDVKDAILTAIKHNRPRHGWFTIRSIDWKGAQRGLPSLDPIRHALTDPAAKFSVT